MNRILNIQSINPVLSVVVLLMQVVWPLSPMLAHEAALKRTTTPTTVQWGSGETANLKLLSSSEQSILLELRMPGFRLEQADRLAGTLRIEVPGMHPLALPGQPALPHLRAMLGVPPGVSVTLRILEDERETLPGSYRIAAAPVPAPVTEELSPGRWQPANRDGFTPNLEVDQPGIFPLHTAVIGEEGWLRNQRFVRVDFQPLQIKSEDGSLLWHKRLLVEVSFSGDRSFDAPGPDDTNSTTAFENLLQSVLLNYAPARQWRSDPPVSAGQQLLDEKMPDITGERYRIAVRQEGLYRLTYEQLAGAGLDVANLNPTYLKMTNQGEEIAIAIQENDGKANQFSPGEALIFYGEAFRGDRLAARHASESDAWASYSSQRTDGSYFTWHPQFNATMVEKYTDENVYWLEIGSSPGKRMATVSSSQQSAPVPTSFLDTVRAEQSHYWKLTVFVDEDSWYWDRLDVNPVSAPAVTRTYTVTLHHPAPGFQIPTLSGEVVGGTNNSWTTPDHRAWIAFNNEAGNVVQSELTWDGISRLEFDIPLSQGALLDGTNVLTYTAVSAQSASDTHWFNGFAVSYQRQYIASDNELAFSGDLEGTWRYQIAGISSNEVGVLDVSDPLTPTMITGYAINSGILSYVYSNPAGSQFYTGPYRDLTASEIVPYVPPILTGPAEYVLITHRDFMTATQRLADYRAKQGMSTLVVDVQDLYNQFTDGIFHPIAVKEFLRYAFANWSAPPTYVLLVGDGHWNFDHSPLYNSPPVYMPPNLVWVDPWQGEVDSANLLANVAGNDPLPDVFIARMPVKTSVEMDTIVNKIIGYEASLPADWQRRWLFVADNTPDAAGDFVAYAEGIIADYLSPGYVADRIYEDDYGCTPNQACPQVTNAITRTLNVTGSLLVNYIGHGSVQRWAHELMLTNLDLPTLSNADRLPVVLSMTCLDGYWSHPGLTGAAFEGLIEEMLRAQNGGAVAAFSPTGLGVSTGHDDLHRGFYDALFLNNEWTMGAATQSAKLRLYLAGANPDLLHTFTLFGDPALQIKRVADVYLPVVSR